MFFELIKELYLSDTQPKNDIIEFLEKLKAKGVKMGRKVGSIKSKEQKTNEYSNVIKHLKKGQSIRNTAKLCGVSVSTVQRVKKEFGL